MYTPIYHTHTPVFVSSPTSGTYAGTENYNGYYGGYPSYGYGYGYGNSGGSGGYNPVASAMSVSCAATPLSAATGETITWYSSVTGGSGNYQYFWSGSDGLTGYSSTVRRAYDTPGDKTATLTVTSDGQSITIGCNRPVHVGVASSSSAGALFGLSCFAAPERAAQGESVTWLSVLGGPVSTTTWNWEGSDVLSGSGPAAFKTYTTNGQKRAVVTATVGGSRISAVCTNFVTVASKTFALPAAAATAPVKQKTATAAITPLQISCNANPNEAEIGDKVVWSAVAFGGAGTTTYQWSGDEGLSGTTATTAKAYSTAGGKRAFVTAASNGQSVTTECQLGATIKPFAAHELTASARGSVTDALFKIISLLALVISLIALWLATRKDEKGSPQGENSATAELIPDMPRRDELESH